MKMRNNTFFLLLGLFIFSPASRAQTYEIRAGNKGGGTVGVEMRATSGVQPGVSNYVTDIVFGIRWLSGYNVDLLNTITTGYNIIKSDTRKTKGGYYFQAFSAANTPFS